MSRPNDIIDALVLQVIGEGCNEASTLEARLQWAAEHPEGGETT